MNHKIKIIKRADRKEPEFVRLDEPSPCPSREITSTIKLWVSEFKERRRTNDDRSRIAIELMKNAESVG